MTLNHTYMLWAVGYACYTLGMMHVKGHTHWKNMGIAIVTGLLWPAAMMYGIYAVHFKGPNAEVTSRPPRAID